MMYARCLLARSGTPDSSDPIRPRTRSEGRVVDPEDSPRYWRNARRTISELLRCMRRQAAFRARLSSSGIRTVNWFCIGHP